MRRFLAQFTRFGVVGLVGLVVDFAIFNLLLNTVFAPESVHGGPLYAKLVSTSVAILSNWLGNRYWTFREHRGPQLWREGLEFAVVSIGGLLIGLGCLWVSHYALGFTSRLADNLASNVVGLGLGTAFRFLLYRYWVFRPRRGEPHVFEDESDAGEGVPGQSATGQDATRQDATVQSATVQSATGRSATGQISAGPRDIRDRDGFPESAAESPASP